MADYTLSLTAGQDAVVTRVATAEGYASNLAFIRAVLLEAIPIRDKANDSRLIGLAHSGGVLTAAQQARVKTVLGLS